MNGDRDGGGDGQVVRNTQVRGSNRGYELRRGTGYDQIKGMRRSIGREQNVLFERESVKDIKKGNIRWRNRRVNMKGKVTYDKQLRREGGECL